MKPPRIRLPSGSAVAAVLDAVCLLGGVVLLTRGVWLIYPPAAWIICGLLLIVFGIWPGQRRGD